MNMSSMPTMFSFYMLIWECSASLKSTMFYMMLECQNWRNEPYLNLIYEIFLSEELMWPNVLDWIPVAIVL